MPSPVFQPGMWVRCKIQGFDHDNKTYRLKYQDGPYMAHDEADGTVSCVLIGYSYSYYRHGMCYQYIGVRSLVVLYSNDVILI